jgi:hypothetical protein
MKKKTNNVLKAFFLQEIVNPNEYIFFNIQVRGTIKRVRSPMGALPQSAGLCQFWWLPTPLYCHQFEKNIGQKTPVTQLTINSINNRHLYILHTHKKIMHTDT